MQVNDLVAVAEEVVSLLFWEKSGFEGLKESSFWAGDVAAAVVGGSLTEEEMALRAAEEEEAAIWCGGILRREKGKSFGED